MKIALCFSGQPRYVERCAPLILKHLIQDYEMDVFAHLWFDEQLTQAPFKVDDTGNWENQTISKNAISIFKQCYQPKAIKVESSKSFSDPDLFVDRARSEKMFWSNGSNDPMLAVREINNSLSYFYSLNAVLTLLKLHEYEHNFKYDWVIRCRTDCEIHEPIRLVEYDPKPKHNMDLMQTRFHNFLNSCIPQPVHLLYRDHISAV